MEFSPDDNCLVVVYSDGKISLYNWKQSKLIKTFQLPDFQDEIQLGGGWRRDNSLHFVPFESSTTFYLSSSNMLYKFSWSTLELIKEYEFSDVIYCISGNEKWIFCGSDDGGIKIKNLETDKEICTLYIIDSLSFITRSPEGLFDATPDAMKYMYYVAGLETIDLEQLKNRYYQPGLLPILLGLVNDKVRQAQSFSKVRLFPETNLTIEKGQLIINLKNRGGGIGKVTISVDGIRIIEDARNDKDTTRGDWLLKIDLGKYKKYFSKDKENKISVVVWNAEEYLSSHPDTISYIPGVSEYDVKGTEKHGDNTVKRIPQLYGIVIGTSDYAGNDIDLKFAAKDAVAFANTLGISATRLFGKENVHISCLTTDDPEKLPSGEAILSAFGKLINISPDDILIVYLSGHGVNHGGQDGAFYYLTMEANRTDASYLNDPVIRKFRTISSDDLAACLNRIPARKKVLILDACSSGSAADGLLSMMTKTIPSSQRRALEFTQEATGAFIIASSATNTASYESSRYGHGLLTYALLKGMKGARLQKIEESEFINVEDLFNYTKYMVPQLAREIRGVQEPIVKTPGTSSRLIIGQMTEEDKKRIDLKEPKAVFQPSQFNNTDLEGMDIALAAGIDARLDQLSAKGIPAELSREGNYPDAYQIKGNYTLKNKKIEVTYILKKGSQIILTQKKISGVTDDLESMIDQIISVTLLATE